MTERMSNTPNDRLPDQLSDSELFRCAADGELNAEQQAELDRRLATSPEAQRRLEAEQSLRAAVGRVMAGEPAPDSVRDRVLSLFAEAAPATVGGAATRTREFWTGVRRWSAVAAVLLVVVSVFIVASQRSPLNAGRPVDIYGDAFQSSVIAHVEREHYRCVAPNNYGARKLNIRDIDEARDFLTGYIGHEAPDLSLMDSGYEFVGIGRCRIPGGKLAVQAVYRDTSADGVYFSLFIQQDGDTPLVEIEDNRCYEPTRDTDVRSPVYLWRSAGLIYYVISCEPDAALAIRSALGCRGAGPTE